MRLSTLPDRDDDRSLAVLAAAIDAGVDLLDTADAYALDDTETGHNERLIARAIAGRRIEVVTKGGLVRPDGAWVPNGRAKHLAAAARASRDRLGVEAIDLYLLHAVDPRTQLATSVRALAKLRDDGIVRAIGLSNITPTQLEEALAITRIDAIEVELHPWKLDAVRGGLVALCEREDIRLLAHRPLGGPPGAKRIPRDPVLVQLADQLGVSPHEVALAWLRSLSPVIVPIPGATRIVTAVAAARAAQLALDEPARTALAARFLDLGVAAVRGERVGGELVVVLGMPGAGKSTLAEDYAARGFVRLNRDERGGTLIELAREVDRTIADGADRVVVDNTYASRASRAPLVAIAKRHGLAIRCIAVTTPLEQAQSNAVVRMLARHGRLLEPAELGARGEIAPNVQFKYRRDYEPPRVDEGFTSVEEVRAPRRITGTRRGLVVELDGVVWSGRPRTPADFMLLPDARDALRRWPLVAGTTWQPGADAGALAALADCLRRALEIDISVLACTHPAGPPICWCRKPLPGLALQLAHERDLDLSKTLHLGRGPADRGFALRAGMPYVEISAGWPSPDDPLPLAAEP
jgi:aryl-alcohol dehydrogenase-like predicted oxidoreductase